MVCENCGRETEPALRYHERGDCEAAAAGTLPDPAAIRHDPRYHFKAGAVFEPTRVTHTCESPFTAASIIPQQLEYLAEENRRLTARVRELEAENTTLRAKQCYADGRGCRVKDRVKAYSESARPEGAD